MVLIRMLDHSSINWVNPTTPVLVLVQDLLISQSRQQERDTDMTEGGVKPCPRLKDRRFEVSVSVVLPVESGGEETES